MKFFDWIKCKLNKQEIRKIEEYSEDAYNYRVAMRKLKDIESNLFNINHQRSLFFNKIAIRGEEYFCQGKIVDLKKADCYNYVAIAKGAEDYNVNIRIKDRIITDTFCTCPFYLEDGEAKRCKHIYAMIKTIYDVENRSYLWDKANEIIKDFSKEIAQKTNGIKKWPVNKSDLRSFVNMIGEYEEVLINAKKEYNKDSIQDDLENLVKELLEKGGRLLDEIDKVIKIKKENEFEIKIEEERQKSRKRKKIVKEEVDEETFSLVDALATIFNNFPNEENDELDWKYKYYYDEFEKCYKYCPDCVHRKECRDYGLFWGKNPEDN